MEADKSILLQKQVRDNSEDLRNEYLDMKNWEEQMKKADAEIRNAGGDQILPPVRRKKKAAKESSKPSNKENATDSKRIKSHDYSAWEKFDAEKACEEAERDTRSDDDGEEPLSKEELEKNHAAATQHKVEGNNFVRREKWAEAVACYSRAIKVFPYDAVFFANRALCHLKMDNLYMAEADCTAAIQLDEFYVKAYHRRATARTSLKQYESAARDIKTILKLEPSNNEAKIMLARVNKSLENSKPIIISTTRDEALEPEVGKSIEKNKPGETGNDEKIKKAEEIGGEKVIDGKNEGNVEQIEKVEKSDSKVLPALPEWLPEVQENVDVVEAITKPPHQRSKKPLRTVPIEEIEFGAKTQTIKDAPPDEKLEELAASDGTKECPLDPENIDVPDEPKTAVQFLLTWRRNASTEFRYKYLKKIPAARIPAIFQDSMESNTFSEILNVLRREFIKRQEAVFDYLRHLSEVKRFRTLTMFMSNSDRDDVQELFDYAKTVEGQSDKVVKNLVVKYEL